MSTDFHTHVREVIEAALQQPDETRDDFLRTTCAGDSALLREVHSMFPHYVKIANCDLNDLDQSALRLPGTTTMTRLVDDSTAVPEWSPPFALPPYNVTKLLGRGGMGVVYLATHAKQSDTVAIKILSQRLRSREDRRRFKYEEAVLRQLRHPGIARLIKGGIARIVRYGSGWSTAEEQPYIVMEYIAGLSLTNYANQQQLSTIKRLELLVHICAAVEYAHHRGVIHRDLKPDNILVDGQGHPRILDFGIAQLQSFDTSTEKNTARHFTGTLAYASPEQCSQRAVTPTPASDVYALGLIAHELLTGQLPRREAGRTRIALAPGQLFADLPPEVATEFRRVVHTIITTALRKAVKRRLPTAGILGAALDKVVQAYASPKGWQRILANLTGLLRGDVDTAAGQPNRLLAAVLRKRIESDVEHDKSS
ncbi:MAG: serine/threonine-protein kinase [Planctomycetota bacterium]